LLIKIKEESLDNKSIKIEVESEENGDSDSESSANDGNDIINKIDEMESG
jgi:hypothetical protein